MARTIEQWQQDLMDKVAVDTVLGGLLTSTSGVSIYRLFLYIVAFCAWTIDNLHDLFKKEVQDFIYAEEPHTARWYVKMAKLFEYGQNLVPEKDYYDNTGLTDDQVAASKIISYAAFVELPYVRLKVAKKAGASLGPLTDAELNAFRAYVMRFKDAGVKLKLATTTSASTITSGDPDKLRLVCRFKFNPLVLDDTGARIDGTSTTPVPDAIRGYLENIDFNGLFSIQKLVDAVQAVDGYSDFAIDQIQTQYGVLPFTAVNIDFVPDGGYLVIEDADLIITYIPA